MTEFGGFTNLMVSLGVSNVQTLCGQRALAIPARHGVLVECFPHNVFVMLWMSYLTREVLLCSLRRIYGAKWGWTCYNRDSKGWQDWLMSKQKRS